MNKTSKNVLFGIILVIITIPASFIGRFIAEVIFTLYYTITRGRFPIYDWVLNTLIGKVVKIFFTEGIILYSGLLLTAVITLRLFKKLLNDIYFKEFWIAHFIIQIILLIVIMEKNNLYPNNENLMILCVILYTSIVYLSVYKTIWPPKTNKL